MKSHMPSSASAQTDRKQANKAGRKVFVIKQKQGKRRTDGEGKVKKGAGGRFKF